MTNIQTILEAIRMGAARHKRGETKPLGQQALEMASLWLSDRLMPGEYLSYGYDRMGEPVRRHEYVSNHWHWHEHLPRLNDHRFQPVLRNKWIFDRYIRSFGFPLPECVGLLHPWNGVTPAGGALRTPTDLADALGSLPSGWILKPVDGGMGVGVIGLEAIASSASGVVLQIAGGESLDGDEAFARWFSAQDSAPLMVQERVCNHADIARMSDGATSTVRIVTLRTPEGGVLVPFASARFGRHGAVVDNYSRGGVLVSVNPETGVLGTGSVKVRGVRREAALHPDTGIPIAGKTLPWWTETITLARELSGVVPQIRSVGWDIIITREGPCVLEGNEAWAMMMMQSLGKGYLSDNAVREALVGHGVRIK